MSEPLSVWDLPRNDVAACRKLCESRPVTGQEWRVMLRLQDDPAQLVEAAKTWRVSSADPPRPTASARIDDDGPGEERSFASFSVVVESPEGSTREWVDVDGTAGSTTMLFDYGYIVGAAGSDGDSVDVYLGPDEDAEWAYVVHQQRKPGFDEYDEDKVMLGFDSADAARDAYLAQYDDERFFGGMTVLSVDELRRRVQAGVSGKITHEAG